MITLYEGPLTVAVEPGEGGRLAGIDIDGHPVLASRFRVGGADPLAWGCYPMVPWAGRLNQGRLNFEGRTYQLPLNMGPHAIHGTTLWQEWEPVMQTPTMVMLRTDLGPPWPFGGHALHTVNVAADRLRLELEVHADERPMPAAVGWHPWFSRRIGRAGPAELDLTVDAQWERGADQIPTGRLIEPQPGPWDDCFTGIGRPPTITWPRGLTLTIESDCPHLVVYDEPDDTICLEPQTLPPDGLNHDPPVVRPGEPLKAECVMHWDLLD